jgi:hypothetical protein
MTDTPTEETLYTAQIFMDPAWIMPDNASGALVDYKVNDLTLDQVDVAIDTSNTPTGEFMWVGKNAFRRDVVRTVLFTEQYDIEDTDD